MIILEHIHMGLAEEPVVDSRSHLEEGVARSCVEVCRRVSKVIETEEP